MIGDGIENCVSAVHNFDPSKSTNPFAYFTQIAWNAFIRRIQSEKKQSYIKHKNYQNNFLMSDQQMESISTNEYSDDVIRAFEAKLKLTKDSKKVKIESTDENSIDN
jgi:DNA-directed RNA polymerase specialized sigma24 family protein